MQKRISLDLVFNEEVDEGGNYYDLDKVTLSYSEVAPEYRQVIAESLAQSDFGYIDLPDRIFEAIDSREAVEFK